LLRAFEELAQKDAPFSPYPVLFLIAGLGVLPQRR